MFAIESNELSLKPISSIGSYEDAYHSRSKGYFGMFEKNSWGRFKEHSLK